MNKRPHIRTFEDLRGIRDARVHSIPKQQRSVHLDLYVLAREKERLEKELSQLGRRVRLVKKRLARGGKRMAKLIGEIGRLQQAPSAQPGLSKNFRVKKMRMEY